MSSTGNPHFRIRVSGHVQGVWYRKHTQEKAGSLGLSGTVQNMPDGSVLIHATGERPALEALLAWCAKGPPAARVEAVSTEELPPAAYAGFSVLR